jgi:alpha-tubulin suppressor-like RCC1 family protein
VRFSQLQAGDDFVVAIDSRGTLYTWGQNDKGQLGNGSNKASSGPVIIQSDVKFASITAGKNFVLAVDESGALWAWGSNEAGQYGNGNKDSSNTPQRVSDGPWKSVTASRFSDTVIGIDRGGKLFSWGSGANALLGTGTDWRAAQVAENQRVEREIARIKANDATRRQGIVNELNNARLTELRSDWATKDNEWRRANREPVISDFPTAPTPRPTPGATPTPTPTPTGPREPYNREAFDRAHKTWEDARTAWLAANPIPNSTDVFTKEDRDAIEAEVGRRYKDTDVSNIVPIKIPEPEIAVEALSPVRIESVVNFTTVSIGSENAFARDSLGRLWAWGSDKNGQTGFNIDEDTHTHLPLRMSETAYTDVFAGDKWAVAAGRNGLFTWGLNSEANPLQSDQPKLLTATKIRDGQFARLTGSSATGAASQPDGSTITWGANTDGIAGRNSPDANVGMDLIEGRYSKLAFGRSSALALGAGPGNLFFWGSDKDATSASTTPFKDRVLKPQQHMISKFIDVAAGRLSSDAVDANGFVWTWGLNWMAAIGAPGNAVGQPTQVPVGTRVTKIAASQTDVMVLTGDNELRWWGAHSPGSQITGVAVPESVKLEAVTSIQAGKHHFAILDESGEAFSFLTEDSLAIVNGQALQTLTKIELPGAASSVAAGDFGSIALIDGKAYGWGDNTKGQLDPAGDTVYLGEATELPTPYEGGWSKLAFSGTHLLGVSDKGVLYGWGHSKYIEGLGTAKPTKPIHFSISVEKE